MGMKWLMGMWLEWAVSDNHHHFPTFKPQMNVVSDVIKHATVARMSGVQLPRYVI